MRKGFALFTPNGDFTGVAPTVDAALGAAQELGAKNAVLEVDQTVLEHEAGSSRKYNGPRTPEVALKAAGLSSISYDEVMKIQPKDAVRILAPFAPHIEKIRTPSGLADWILGQNAKTKKSDEREGVLPAWVMGLSLLPHHKAFDPPDPAPAQGGPGHAAVIVRAKAFAKQQKPFDKRVLQMLNARPGREASREPTFCLGSSEACRSTCLVYTGQNESDYSPVIAKRVKSNMLLLEPAAFLRALIGAMELHIRTAARDFVTVKGVRHEGPWQPYFRLNVYQDIPWEILCPWLFDMFPHIQFYDYTKVSDRVTPKNYHLSFSYSGDSHSMATCKREAARGLNPVFVFAIGRNDPKPKRFNLGGTMMRVINGDESDVRPRDPKNVIVGLFYKTPKRRQVTADPAFVVPCQIDDDQPDGPLVIIASTPRQENQAGADIAEANLG